MRDDPDKRSHFHGNCPPHQLKSEYVAQQILKKLLRKRSFQKYLIDSTVKEILNNAGSTDTTQKQRSVIQNVDSVPSASYRHVVIYENVDLLICHLKLIAESFIKSSNFAFCDFGANVNRDAAALFSVRLKLEQFLNCDHFQLLRFEQLVRRLYTLLRCFATRISTPFQIPNCALFASGLCDLLYRFEEFCSIHERNCATKFEQLQKAISVFHDVVVRRLNEMIKQRIKEEYEGEEIVERRNSSSNLLRRTQNKPKFAGTFREVEHLLRSPGYLLPHELREERRLIHSRRTASLPSSRQKFFVPKETAHRLAREITEEMMNDLSARVDDVLLIS